MAHIEWQFGGWLRDWPVPASAALLTALGAAGIVYVVWFYRRTLAELTPRARRWLTDSGTPPDEAGIWIEDL